MTVAAMVVTRYTLATATGAIGAALKVHVLAGVVGTVTGFVALFTAKGARTHKRSGIAFFYAMLTMALVGAGIAAVEGNGASIDAGLFAAYFVVTALTTVRPPTPARRRIDLAAMLVALAVALGNTIIGVATIASGARTKNGVPVVLLFVFGAIALGAALGDARVLWRGAPRGIPRLVRHLWRMCFSLFIATGSSFLGQAHLIPKPYRFFPVLSIPVVVPFLAIAYWLWRLRVRRNVRGITGVGPVSRADHGVVVPAAAGLTAEAPVSSASLR